MEMASEIGRGADLPVYVHFGQLWALPPEGANGVDADTIIERTVALLRPGDILAHPFTRHPGGFVDKDGKVHPIIKAALEMGLKIDVGHGSHFSYRLARKALDAGIVPHTLGADMHGYNTFVPPPPGTPGEHPDDENHPVRRPGALQPHPGDELDAGARAARLQQVVPMVTSNAAVMAGIPDEIGALKPGMDGRCFRARRRSRPLPAAGTTSDTEVVAERLLRARLLPARRPALRRDCADPAARDRGVVDAARGWATLEPGGARRRL